MRSSDSRVVTPTRLRPVIICERRLAAGHDVAQPQLERLDANLVGDDVEQALAR